MYRITGCSVRGLFFYGPLRQVKLDAKRMFVPKISHPKNGRDNTTCQGGRRSTLQSPLTISLCLSLSGTAKCHLLQVQLDPEFCERTFDSPVWCEAKLPGLVSTHRTSCVCVYVCVRRVYNNTLSDFEPTTKMYSARSSNARARFERRHTINVETKTGRI